MTQVLRVTEAAILAACSSWFANGEHLNDKVLTAIAKQEAPTFGVGATWILVFEDKHPVIEVTASASE